MHAHLAKVDLVTLQARCAFELYEEVATNTAQSMMQYFDINGLEPRLAKNRVMMPWGASGSGRLPNQNQLGALLNQSDHTDSRKTCCAGSSRLQGEPWENQDHLSVQTCLQPERLKKHYLQEGLVQPSFFLEDTPTPWSSFSWWLPCHW